MHVVLVHPEIPGNTGNIARTCVATNTHLHLIRPMAFVLDDKRMKRAGLDYWSHLKLTVHESLERFKADVLKDQTPFLFSRFATTSYWEVTYPKDSILMFGSESKGLPQELKDQYSSTCVALPTPGEVRSLNLSTTAGIALFEALRQQL